MLISSPSVCKKSSDSNAKIHSKKSLNLGPKMSYLGIFVIEFSKNYFHIYNQQPRDHLNSKCYDKKL